MTKIRIEKESEVDLMKFFAKEGASKSVFDEVQLKHALQSRIKEDRYRSAFPDEINSIKLGSVNGESWFTLMYKEGGDDEWRTCSSSSHDVEKAKKSFPDWFINYLDTREELVI